MDDTTDDARPSEPTSTDHAQPSESTAADAARPDQLESEMLFGETIAWMRPNAPLFRPEPETEREPEPVRLAAASAPVLDQLATPPSSVKGDETEGDRRSRKRALLIGAGV